MGLRTALTYSLLALGLVAPAVAAPSTHHAPAPLEPRASSFWVGSIQRQGTSPFGTNMGGYKVFRNVMDYGAKGDGVTDDTAAINAAVSDGSRCGKGCDSTTTQIAIVYFPAGTFLVSKPIIQLYYTQFIGDAITPPTLKAAANFQGMAVIDTDPYDSQGNNWWVNQNNFFRQIRNFNIDLTAMPMTSGAGIHLQVAQASSLQNIHFNMHQDKGPTNAQLGIFMDNGSGSLLSDLTFTGGNYGFFFGNQQFTLRNMTFNGCKTAMYLNWDWVAVLKDLTINDCDVGLDMSNGGSGAQTVGSVIVTDSVFRNTGTGIKTAFQASQSHTNGTLILTNVDMSSGVKVAVQNNGTGAVVLNGNQKIASYVQGRVYNTNSNVATRGKSVQPSEPGKGPPIGSVLLGPDGRVFTRSRPQYENVPVSAFLSVKSNGAKGDGVTDDTAAIQALLSKATPDQVVYFDHGAYLVTDTVRVPKNVRITGEIWPVILAGGSKSFKDEANPKPVFQIGQPGDVGTFEMSDMIFSTAGPQPGAVMLEWNINGTTQGAAGMWDVHVRIGGAAGTQMELSQCAKNPNSTAAPNTACYGAFLMIHIAPTGSAYLENVWAWAADHSLEPAAKSQQIDIYNARGILIEGPGPVWGYGTASEHSVLYNYQLSNASNVYLSLIQTETPYFQGNPQANAPFTAIQKYGDPDFPSMCPRGSPAGCARSWGLRAVNSQNSFIFGAGLYSFFDNYDQDCLKTESCQQNMVGLENSQVSMFGLSTKASVNMLTVNNVSMALDKDNRNNFCATLAKFVQGGS